MEEDTAAECAAAFCCRTGRPGDLVALRSARGFRNLIGGTERGLLVTLHISTTSPLTENHRGLGLDSSPDKA